MSIFVCPRCSQQIDTDFHAEDVYDDGEEMVCCMDCYEDSVDKEMAYWWPLYKGEKSHRESIRLMKEDGIDDPRDLK